MVDKGAIALKVWIGSVLTPIHLTVCYMSAHHKDAFKLALNYVKQSGQFGRNAPWFINFSRWGKNSDLVIGINNSGYDLDYLVSQIFTLIDQSYGSYIDKSIYTSGRPPLHANVSMLQDRPSGQTWLCTLALS